MMHLTLTAAHLAPPFGRAAIGGVRDDLNCVNDCPVARALREVTGTLWHVAGGLAWCGARMLQLSPEARRFVMGWYPGCTLAAITFTASPLAGYLAKCQRANG